MVNSMGEHVKRVSPSMSFFIVVCSACTDHPGETTIVSASDLHDTSIKAIVDGLISDPSSEVAPPGTTFM